MGGGFELLLSGGKSILFLFFYFIKYVGRQRRDFHTLEKKDYCLVHSQSKKMIIAIILLVLLAISVAFLLLYFGNWKTFPWYVQITCFIAWLFPFAIILILPLDLASVSLC